MKLVLVLIYSTSKDSRNKTQVELIFYKGGFLYLPTTPDPTRPVSRWHLLARLSPGWPRTPTTSRTTRWPPPSSTSTSRRVGLLYLVFMFIIKVDFFAEEPKNLQLRFFFGRVEASSKKHSKLFHHVVGFHSVWIIHAMVVWLEGVASKDLVSLLQSNLFINSTFYNKFYHLTLALIINHHHHQSVTTTLCC